MTSRERVGEGPFVSAFRSSLARLAAFDAAAASGAAVFPFASPATGLVAFAMSACCRGVRNQARGGRAAISASCSNRFVAFVASISALRSAFSSRSSCSNLPRHVKQAVLRGAPRAAAGALSQPRQCGK